MARITDGMFKGKVMTFTVFDTPSDYLVYGCIPELDEKVDSDNVEDRLIAVKKHYALEILCNDPDWRVRLAVVKLGYLEGRSDDPSERVRKAWEEYRMTRIVDSKTVYIMCKKFSEIRKELLTEYAETHQLPVGGTYTYRGKQYEYGHILKFAKGKRIEAIEKYNLLSGLRFDGFISAEKVHRYAHHLNSSQVLCYNFFRPMLNDDHTSKQELVALLKEQGIHISENAKCDFEYDDYMDFKEERTEFDFHVADGDTEVFFEIKYMEDGFGGAKTDPRHREKFNGTYSDMLKKCRCLKDNNPSYKDFLKNYQLYRNVLRITDKHKYTIFITAKGNAKTYTQLDAFLKNINDEYKGNVIALYWEDLIEKGHPLFDKYIAV